MLAQFAALLAAASVDGAYVTHDRLDELLASRDAVASRLEQRIAALEAENVVLRARRPLETSPQPSAPSVSNVGASGAASPPTVPIASTGKADGRRGTSVHMQAGEVEANGGARRLSSGSSSYLSVDGDRSLVHAFPDSHSCPLGSGAYKQVLPLTSSGAASWDPSPFATDTVQLASVGDGWTVNEIASYPAPFKLFHDSSCAVPPTLEVQLNTTIDGTLTVTGALTAPPLAWIAFPMASNMQRPHQTSSNGPYLAQYAIRDGLVFLRGAVGPSSGGTFSANTQHTLGTLPAEATPSSQRITRAVGFPTTGGANLFILPDGRIQFQTSSSSAQSCFLDGVSFSL